MTPAYAACVGAPQQPCDAHFLHPGECYFGGARSRLRTVLGSCIAITLWHPRRHIGGMCHYMLPTRLVCATGSADQADGLYADGALRIFLQGIGAAQTCAEDYEVKLFGGARMFGDAALSHPINVGSANIEAGRRMLLAHGFTIKREHAGANGSRDVIFDMHSGLVWVKHSRQAPPERLTALEGAS